jgi:hypothetical protein
MAMRRKLDLAGVKQIVCTGTACAQLHRLLRPRGWEQLDEPGCFALVKLSHPGHEHRNPPRALEEFGGMRERNDAVCRRSGKSANRSVAMATPTPGAGVMF